MVRHSEWRNVFECRSQFAHVHKFLSVSRPLYIKIWFDAGSRLCGTVVPLVVHTNIVGEFQ